MKHGKMFMKSIIQYLRAKPKKKINTASYDLKKVYNSIDKMLEDLKKIAVEIHKAAMCADYISKD